MPDVYIMRTDPTGDFRGIYPPARRLHIENTKNAELKSQRIASWQALMQALERSFGIKPESLEFYQSENGAWKCGNPNIFFSLSHSGEFAAAAVSQKTVGLDIELASSFEKLSESRKTAIFSRICSEREKTENTPADLPGLWTQKESIFKYSGEKSFSPSEIEVINYPVKTVLKNELVISVCSEEENLRIIEL